MQAVARAIASTHTSDIHKINTIIHTYTHTLKDQSKKKALRARGHTSVTEPLLATYKDLGLIPQCPREKDTRAEEELTEMMKAPDTQVVYSGFKDGKKSKKKLA